MSDGKLTLARLKKFIKIRNKSEFDTNFAFCSDADLAGFDVKELGNGAKLPHYRPFPSIPIYYWITPFGILVEKFFQLRLFRYPKAK